MASVSARLARLERLIAPPAAVAVAVDDGALVTWDECRELLERVVAASPRGMDVYLAATWRTFERAGADGWDWDATPPSADELVLNQELTALESAVLAADADGSEPMVPPLTPEGRVALDRFLADWHGGPRASEEDDL